MGSSLLGRKAVVTGAGRGIGREIARTFAMEGAVVVGVARTGSELNQVVEEIRSVGGKAHAVVCDVGDAASVERMFLQAEAVMGGVDLLVNNAGGSTERHTTVAESDPDLWSTCLRVNVIGVYLCARFALPRLIGQGGGHLVNMGSGMGHEAGAGNASYRTAKAALSMFTKCLALEVAAYGIAVNEIVPGPVLTPATEKQFELGSAPPWSAVERVKPPEEVADLALWLATRPSGGPTGQCFSLARRPLPA